MADWRNIKEGQTIFKFDAEKEHEIITLTFLSEGRVKEFNVERFDNKTGRVLYAKGQSVEFDAELDGKKGVFSTGSNRLITALQNVASDLTGKKVKMEKNGLGMDTFYTAKLIK